MKKVLTLIFTLLVCFTCIAPPIAQASAEIWQPTFGVNVYFDDPEATSLNFRVQVLAAFTRPSVYVKSLSFGISEHPKEITEWRYATGFPGLISNSWFTFSYDNLKPKTIYVYKVKIETANGTFESEIKGVETMPASEISASSISLNKKTMSIQYGKTGQLKATVKPKNAKYTWSSDDPIIATVDQSGLVQSKGVGTTTIKATTTNGKEAKCKVTVKPLLVSKLKINNVPNKNTIYVGQTYELDIDVLPDGANDKRIQLKSSNEYIVSVDSDKKSIKAEKLINWKRGYDEIKITVTSKDGGKAKSSIKVRVKMPEGVKASLNTERMMLELGETAQIKVNVDPSWIGADAIFRSDDKKIATVGETDGLVTAKKEGTTTITVTPKYTNPKLTLRCTVTVSDSAKNKEIAIKQFSMNNPVWSNIPIGSSTIGADGCFVTCYAILLSNEDKTGREITPKTVAENSNYDGADWKGFKPGSGFSHPNLSSAWDAEHLVKQIRRGKPVMFGGGHTTGEHYVIIYGYKDLKYDPSGKLIANNTNFLVHDTTNGDKMDLEEAFKTYPWTRIETRYF